LIGLATNVIVRYLTHDDPTQTAAAMRLINSLTSDSPGFLCLIVVAELVWVLETSYRFKKKEIQQVVESLLRSRELVIEQAEIVSIALRTFRTGRADFVDCLIEHRGNAAKCQYTVTFDRAAAEGAGMRLLK
jgi:predicted nucleic-acid-binding protein